MNFQKKGDSKSEISEVYHFSNSESRIHYKITGTYSIFQSESSSNRGEQFSLEVQGSTTPGNIRSEDFFLIADSNVPNIVSNPANPIRRNQNLPLGGKLTEPEEEFLRCLKHNNPFSDARLRDGLQNVLQEHYKEL